MPETINTDPLRVRQILVNLVGNAIKFTEQGAVTIRAAIEQDADGSGLLIFDVIDSGIGMSAEQVSRLFQPFSQADTSTTRTFGGTGLGLTISRRLALLLDGDVGIVSSQPGRGTQVRLQLNVGPLSDMRMIERPSINLINETREHAMASPLSDRAITAQILLAEDGEDNQDFVASLLRKAGARVDVVPHGQAAVERVLGSTFRRRATDPPYHYDVILMDMQMPIMDGYEATQMLRYRGYKGPIIALTAHAMESDRQKCLMAGCDDFATKPVRRAALLETIQKHLQNPQGTENAEMEPDSQEQADTQEQVIETEPMGDRQDPLISSRADDPDLEALLERFISRLPQRIETLKAALDANDWDQLETAAHQLKGAAGGYGFDIISTTASELEASAHNHDNIDTLQQKAHELIELCIRARAKAPTASDA